MNAFRRLPRRLVPLALGLAMVGCGSDQFQDLKQFVADAETVAGNRARIDPLPKVDPYEPFVYNQAELEDPFRPRKIEPTRSAKGQIQPDLNRRREPLEAFPLDNLRMVGSLQQGKTLFALIRTPDKNLFRVRQNNYIGQNFGLIIEVDETGLKLKELVQDGAGEWTERITSLFLQDETEARP
ncbi:MAG: pilus assembly protein PilP [bacterium]|jgi:type IV pilus assembly protein PilP|nr:pilus assembly protein PilP [Betaproteobacteria bacterium]